jgi:hypothetical protein
MKLKSTTTDISIGLKENIDTKRGKNDTDKNIHRQLAG